MRNFAIGKTQKPLTKMKKIILMLGIVMLIILVSGCELYKTRYMINTNNELKQKCETAALNYDFVG